MPLDASPAFRSRLELVRRAWLLPWVAARLAAGQYALYLARRPVPEILEAVARRPAGGSFRAPTSAQRERLAVIRRLGTLCLRWLFFSSRPCLPRGLLLLGWCRDHGVLASLVIGVARQGAGLRGHCWLEIDGAPFFEDQSALAGFQPLIRASSRSGVSYAAQSAREDGHAIPLC